MGVMIQRPGAFVHHKPRPSNSAVRVDRSRHAASPGVYRLLLAGHWRGEAVRPAKAVAKDSRSVTSLSELITFESELEAPLPQQPGSQEDPTLRAQELLARASRVLAAAKDVVGDTDGAAGQQPGSPGISSGPAMAGVDTTRSVLRASLESTYASPPTGGPSSSSSSSRAGGSEDGGSRPGGSATPSTLPSWAESMFTSGRSSGSGGPQMQRQAQGQPSAVLFAEPEFRTTSFLNLESQDEQDALAARSMELPPLQSVLDLTSASQPPLRQAQAQEGEEEVAQPSVSAPTAAGQMLKDGSGVLGDGTRWQKRSGEEFGPDGYWKRWTMLSGSSQDGAVQWEECWWEASDWKGFRELGAAKKGNRADGAAWNEAWSEKVYHDKETSHRMVERTAHKWARHSDSDEWGEQWGEKYSEKGPASKWADKWARQAENVWHERWGEDYDGAGGCLKYTDKWAERLVYGAAAEQWGDKWTESFKDGKGTKHGEVWTAGSDGGRYNRWWNEEHFGNGYVRKYGNSTGGEYWDTTEQMDTYYNPIPHFGFELAVRHSPDLFKIPLSRPGQHKKAAQQAAGAPPPQGPPDDGLGGGIDAL